MSVNRIQKSISMTKDQHEWLRRHPEINASGLLQNAIDDLRKGKEAEQTPEQNPEKESRS